jgi:hypothetical protein
VVKLIDVYPDEVVSHPEMGSSRARRRPTASGCRRRTTQRIYHAPCALSSVSLPVVPMR